MARVSIAYAIKPDNPDLRRPLAVVAQDDETVVIEPVPQNPEALARELGLPSQTYVAWAESRQASLTPIFDYGQSGDGNDVIPVTDPRWLERFVQPGYVDTHAFGPIEDVPGPAADVAKAKARELAS